jgi:hypothetical protein
MSQSRLPAQAVLTYLYFARAKPSKALRRLMPESLTTLSNFSRKPIRLQSDYALAYGNLGLFNQAR